MLLNCGVGEDCWESLGLQGDPTSQSHRKSVLNIHWKYWCWSWSSNTLATWCENWLIGKGPDAGKDWRQEEKHMTEDEMVGWHHQLDGHKFEQPLEVDDGLQSMGSPRVEHHWGTKLNWFNQHFGQHWDMYQKISNRCLLSSNRIICCFSSCHVEHMFFKN